MFDINIGCDRRAGYLYYIEHVEDMERGGVRTWLLNTFAVNHLINESHHLKWRILFEEIPSGQRFLTQIIEAMRDNLTLEIIHQSFWSDTASTFEVAPYCVKVFRQRWYMVGCSMSDRRLRVYALDRIHTLRTIENTFVLPDDFDPEGFFADSFGIVVDDRVKSERMRVRVAGIQRQYIRTLPLHISQLETEITKDSSVFEFYLRPTLDFQQELLIHAINAEDSIEVLEPQWLRERMQAVGEDLFRNHQEA